MRVSFRSKSKEIDEEDLWYYTTERCIEAGEEYDPELKWLELESELGAEVGDDWSSGCSSGVEECSSGEYTSPAVVCLEFVRPSGRGYCHEIRFLDSFLAFTILSLLTGLIILILFLTDYLSYPRFAY